MAAEAVALVFIEGAQKPLQPENPPGMDNRIYGVHAVYEALESQRLPLERIYFARWKPIPRNLQKDRELARERGVPVRKGKNELVLDRLAEGAVHQGLRGDLGGRILCEF